MSLDPDDGEGHPGEVTKGIPWQSSSGVPSFAAQRQLQTGEPEVYRIIPVVILEARTPTNAV